MEEMISKWIRETNLEFQKAKKNLNYYRMHETRILRFSLEEMKEKLFSNK